MTSERKLVGGLLILCSAATIATGTYTWTRSNDLKQFEKENSLYLSDERAKAAHKEHVQLEHTLQDLLKSYEVSNQEAYPFKTLPEDDKNVLFIDDKRDLYQTHTHLIKGVISLRDKTEAYEKELVGDRLHKHRELIINRANGKVSTIISGFCLLYFGIFYLVVRSASKLKLNNTESDEQKVL